MSGHEHLSEDVLLDAVYGIAGEDAEAHVRACAACAGRLSEWRQRASATGTSEISGEFLAAQRRKIHERIERPSRKHWWWAPALAATCALAVGIFIYQPSIYQATPKPKPAANPEVSDAQLFTDVYSMEQTLEPSAAAPVRALFEEQAQ
jgi:hypothetical protein